MPNPDSLTAIALELREFASHRDWAKFHTPRNLTLALIGEVGELAEQIRWMSDQEIIDSRSQPFRDAVADELADVAIFLIRLSDILDISLGDAIQHKLEKNSTRFPSDLVRGKAGRGSSYDTKD